MDLATVDHLLTTTRSVRKRLDLARPVEPEVIERCLDLAIQAPSGSDRQSWHFVVITEPELRLGLAELYRQSFARYRARGPAGPVTPLQSSADYLAEHFHEPPPRPPVRDACRMNIAPAHASGVPSHSFVSSGFDPPIGMRISRSACDRIESGFQGADAPRGCRGRGRPLPPAA